MDERAYWLWMQQAFPPGSRKPLALAEQYPGGVREFLEGGPLLWNVRRDLTDREAEGLRDFSLSQAQARLEYAEKMGWQVITPADPSYPPLLREIPDPPCALFVKGSLPDLSGRLVIGVAGARKAGPEALDAAKRFGYQLALGGAAVVSGGALGVDSSALTGALLAPGAQTVSILPVSLDSNYLGKNSSFRRLLLEQDGALVSEYFSQTVPVPGTFPLRNRLITGVAHGVVLIQAAQKSGTMLYANLALEQNREVFVYPGEEDSPLYAGSRQLLGEGAHPATCGDDVLAEFPDLLPGVPPPRREPLLTALFRPREEPVPAPAQPVLADPGDALTPAERTVAAALGPTAQSVEELAQATGLAPAELLGVLTGLELEGLAESLPGKRFRRGR